MKARLNQKKAIKKMTDSIVNMVGLEEYGTLIAVLADSLYCLVEDVEQRQIRTVEIKYNDYFSTKFDFATRKYVQE